MLDERASRLRTFARPVRRRNLCICRLYGERRGRDSNPRWSVNPILAYRVGGVAVWGGLLRNRPICRAALDFDRGLAANYCVLALPRGETRRVLPALKLQPQATDSAKLATLLPAVRPYGRTGGALFVVADSPISVAVFIDWQNVYKTAREAFGLTNMPNEYGNFSPFQLARALAAGNGRGANGRLVRVEVHRGLPSQRHDKQSYAANRRQSAAWMHEAPQLVIPRLRPLRYPQDFPQSPPVEKGVDVNLALGAIESVLTRLCDVAVMFSHDTDLLPVPETIARLAGSGSVETVSWVSTTFRKRLRPKPAVYHHEVSEAVFKRVETRVNYAHGS